MLAVYDVLDAIFLGCFFFGLLLAAATLLSGLGGAAHLHLPMPAKVGHIHLPHHGPAPSDGHRGGIGPLNTGSLLVFISWFGGWAYLARHGLHWLLAFSLLAGLVGGLIGGMLVFLWLTKVLVRMETALDPADFRLPGTLATVSWAIRPGGVGEIVYEQGGVRHCAPARNLDGTSVPRGTEVVVRSYERGIAAVEPWEVFVGERHRDLVSAPTRRPTSIEDATEWLQVVPETSTSHANGNSRASRPPMALPPPAAPVRLQARETAFTPGRSQTVPAPRGRGEDGGERHEPMASS